MATNKKPKNQSRHANAHMKLYRDMRGKQARAFRGELLPSGHSPKPETLLQRELTKGLPNHKGK